MSLYPCSACNQRPAGLKLASVTWAWNRADGSRAAWRQRLCVPCFAQRILALPQLDPVDPLTCPGCGVLVNGNDMAPIFATAFLPGTGRFDYEWPTCGPCQAQWCASAQVGALQLEDRRGAFGGPGPGPQTTGTESGARDLWAEMMKNRA